MVVQPSTRCDDVVLTVQFEWLFARRAADRFFRNLAFYTVGAALGAVQLEKNSMDGIDEWPTRSMISTINRRSCPRMSSISYLGTAIPIPRTSAVHPQTCLPLSRVTSLRLAIQDTTTSPTVRHASGSFVPCNKVMRRAGGTGCDGYPLFCTGAHERSEHALDRYTLELHGGGKTPRRPSQRLWPPSVLGGLKGQNGQRAHSQHVPSEANSLAA
jgi:hypothetical protein